MRLLLDSGGEGGGGDGKTHVETIRLDVVSPKQDFASQGGIHDAMVALRQLDEYYTGLQGKFKSGFQFGGAGGGVSPSGEIKLTIAGSAIHAALAPGEKIKLNLTGSDFTFGPSGATPSTGGAGTRGTGGMEKPIVPGSSGSGRLLYQVTAETEEGEKLRRRRYAAGNFDRSFREITYGEEEAVKSSTLHEKPAAEGAAEVSANILAKKDELQQKILQGAESEVRAHRLLAAAIRDEVKATEELNALQQARYGAMASRLDLRAQALEKRGANRQQVQMFKDYIREDDAAIKQAQAQRDQEVQRQTAMRTSAMEKQEQAAEQAYRNIKARRIVRERQSTRSAAMQTEIDESAHASYRQTQRDAIMAQGTAYAGIPRGLSATQQRRIEREAEIARHTSLRKSAERIAASNASPGVREQYAGKAAAHYRDEQAAMMSARIETDRFNESTRLIGKNMLQNIKHVTTWAASVGVLYGSIRLLTRSLEENMEIGKQQAILSQIFKGSSEAVQNLTNDVLHLAAANGQSASEAMQSAVEWSRIFHTEREIIQATNASLIEANVSGEEAAKTTEFLSMMVQVYGLRASELVRVIGEMAAISQTANISNVDLMKGMETVGEAAKEAGMSWSQTLGVITGGVAATKQSGTTIANTLKTMITQMANPEIQQKLRLGSGIEVTGAGGELKNMTQILGEMFTAWEKMTDAERRSLLFSVGGRQNATRMAGILDEFILGQVKAINAQLNLNSAESENEKIVGTLKGQVAALAAEWDKFVNIQAAGPIVALRDMATGLTNVIRLLDSPGIKYLTTAVGVLGTALGARMMITGFQMNAAGTLAAGEKGGIGVSTIRALSNDWKAMGQILDETAVKGMIRINTGLRLFNDTAPLIGANIRSMGLAARAASAGFVALTDVLLPLLALWAGLHEANALVKHFSGASAIEKSERMTTDMMAASSANEERASLIGRVAGAIGDPKTSNERRKAMIGQVAGALESGASSKRIDDLERELKLMVDQQRISEVLVELAKAKAEAERLSLGEKFRAKKETEEEVKEYQKAIDLLKKGRDRDNTVTGSFQNLATFFPKNAFEGYDDAIDRFKAKLEEAKQRLVDLAQIMDQHFSDANYLSKMTQVAGIGSAQEIAFSGIGAAASSLGTVTPMDERNRRIAELQRKQSFLNTQMEMMPKGPGADLRGTPFEGLDTDQIAALKGRFMEDRAKNAGELAALQAQGGYAEKQTRLDAYNRYGQSEFKTFGVGLTEGEQIVQQQISGRERRAELRYAAQTERPGSDHDERVRADNAERINIEIGMLQNKANAYEKINELKREEINLNKQATREFERSLLVSSPSELLRKMAVAGLTHGRTMSGPNAITGGEFFSMSQEARQDFMRMPGNTEAERLARRGRSALEHEFFPNGMPSAYDQGQSAVAGAIASSKYANLIPDLSPQLSIHPDTVSAIMDLGSAAARAAAALDRIADRHGVHWGIIDHHNSSSYAPPVTQDPLRSHVMAGGGFGNAY